MTSVRRRPAPLRAPLHGRPDHDGPEPQASALPVASGDDATIGHEVASRTRSDEDRRSFASAVRSLRTGRASLNLSERTLMVLGGVLAPLGLLLILLGWVGAARTPNLFEQVPYLISGGLLGLGLVFLGAFLYFAHWITELVKEGRAQSAALLDAIERLREDVTNGAPATPSVPAAAPGGALPLVATSRGSMVHRADCVVVAGKRDVHVVESAASLEPCKLCEPLSDN